MEVIETPIDGLKLIKPAVHNDERGYFFEAFNLLKLKQIGIDEKFVQENQAFSKKGVLRGLHYQTAPFLQGKLVRAVYGEILDVAVDIRFNSPTYGKHYKTVLSHENNHFLWIPPGFAHGALTISEISLMAYYCTNYYAPDYRKSIVYNDEQLMIAWELKYLILTDDDIKAPRLCDIEPLII